MLEVCRQRAQHEGFEARCDFHVGYVESLPATETYEGATCFLVSQFVLQKDARVEFFRGIAGRLRPEALERMRANYARDVAILPPGGVESIIGSAGFAPPVQFFQAGLIHAWFARRS
jgi:tRNA (cmo5U34)-methyltransferase